MSSNFFQYCFPWQDHYNFHASVWSIIFVRRLSLKSDNRYCSLRSQQLGYCFNRYSEGPRSAFCRCFPGRIQAETYTDHSWKYNRAPSVCSEHLPLLQVQMMNPRLQVQFLPKRDLRFQQKLPCITLTKRCVYFLRELWKANELTLKIP